MILTIKKGNEEPRVINTETEIKRIGKKLQRLDDELSDILIAMEAFVVEQERQDNEFFEKERQNALVEQE